MRRVGLVAVIAIGCLMQISFIPALRPFGVVPALVLVLIIVIGLYDTVSRALIAALSTGIILDLASGAPFGLQTGLLVLAALGTGLIRRAGLADTGLLSAMAVTVGATILGALLELASISNVFSGFRFGALIGSLVIELMVNLSLLLLVRPLVRWLTPRESGVPTIS